MILENQPLVSVGIPTYNRPEGLRRTLGCIIQQTYKNLEIIVSDNCSSNPEVEKVVNEFIKKDLRIRYFRQSENFGPGNNFNFLLENATGEYFMWAADDDEWEWDFIEKNLRLIQSDTRYIASFSNFFESDASGNRKIGYPEHLPYLKQISNFDKYKRLYSFIAQNEKNGKANLFYSLIRTDILKRVWTNFSYINLIGSDDLLILSWLCEGNIAIVESVHYRCIGEYQKYYLASPVLEKRKINLFVLKIDSSIIKNTINGWVRYLLVHFRIIENCDIGLYKKMKLYFLIIFRILLIFYDIVTFSFSTPIFNVFSVFRRKLFLINIYSSQE